VTDRGAIIRIRQVLESPAPDPRTQLEAIERIVRDNLDDPIREADAHARVNARPSGVVPHHVRCNVVDQGRRCRRVDVHSGPHDFEVPE